MIIILLCIFMLCFIGIKVASRGNFFSDYLLSEKTLAVKGLFTLLIFLSHFATYTSMKKPLDFPYAAFKSYLAQAIVAPFLFFSGYGIMFSIIRKENYVKQMPVKRIWKTLFTFHASLLMFFIMQKILGRSFSPVYYLETLFSWKSLGNSDWYVFSILALYFLTYCSFLVFGKRLSAGLVCNAILMLVFTYFMKIYKDGYWYNIYFAYWLGMLYAFRKEEIDKSIMQNDLTWIISILAVICCFYTLHFYRNNLIAYECCALCLALFVVILMMKVSLNNPVLIYCGDHLFSLFILQRIPMTMLRYTSIAANDFIYFLVCLAITFVLSAAFDWVIPKIWIRLENLIQKRVGE